MKRGAGENKYLYNGSENYVSSDGKHKPNSKQGMEYVSDFDLNLNFARYRTYDPAIGRFLQIDPKAEKFYSQTPYNGMLNNPVKYADPQGDCPICARILGGAAAGAAGDYAWQVGGNLWEGKGWSSFTDVDTDEIKKSALVGALGGAAADKFLKARKAKKLRQAQKATKLKQLNKSKKSYEKLVKEHKQKIKDYLKDPDKHDNKGILKKATPEQRKKIIQGRVKALEKQVKKQEGELKKINEQINKIK